MKRFIGLFLSVLLLCGCAGKDNGGESAALTAYEGYYQSVLETAHFQEDSQYFDIEPDMIRLDDGTYRYYIVIDNVQIGMYNIKAMIVENDIPYEENDKMMPTLGVFENTVYHMIPYQSNQHGSYYKGVVLSGECDYPVISVKLMVEWTDRSRTVYNRQYFSFVLEYSEISGSHS